MRELFSFFVNYSTFLTFIGLQSVCLYCLSIDNSYQRVKILNASNSVTGTILSVKNNFVKYVEAEKENNNLKLENERLLTYKFAGQTLFPENLMEKIVGKFSTSDTTVTSKYHFLAANVINNSFIRPNNFITLNKGSKHGVREDQGVISNSGIVGIVKSVSSNYSLVMSVLNSKASISAKLKNNDFVGRVSWDGKNADLACLANIPTHVNITKGDTIVTTGYSTFFPEDVAIGFIETFKPISGSDVYEIKIKLATNFRSLTYVYAVENSEKQEQLELESQTND